MITDVSNTEERMLVKFLFPDRYHLAGVVSAGYSKCHAVRGLPDVFTRLTEYDQWVRDIIAK